MGFIVASIVRVYSHEEIVEFVTSLSWYTLIARVVSVYWPSILVMFISCLVAHRSRNGKWLAIPLLLVVLQQSMQLYELLVRPSHTAWMLRELLAASIAQVVIGVPVLAFILAKSHVSFRRGGILAIGSAVVAMLTVVVDWAFCVYFLTPVLGG